MNSLFKWPSPPRGKTANEFGKLRALEVRLVREVKVLNRFCRERASVSDVHEGLKHTRRMDAFNERSEEQP
jgi:hypothetical protein